MKGKLLEMADREIVSSVNEMMKYSPTACCTLHICFTLLYVIHREKQKEMLPQLQLHSHREHGCRRKWP